MEVNEILTLIATSKDDLWNLALIIILAFLFGGSGSFVSTSFKNAGTSFERWRIWIGGTLAAVASLFIFEPSDLIKLVGLFIIAGYAGISLLDSLKQYFLQRTEQVAKDRFSRIEGEVQKISEAVTDRINTTETDIKEKLKTVSKEVNLLIEEAENKRNLLGEHIVIVDEAIRKFNEKTGAALDQLSQDEENKT
jgi:hypothetical protein